MTILDIILTIGVPAIVIALVYIGRKLQVLDSMERKMEDIYERFIKTEERVETLWKDKVAPAQSPRKLNKYGNTILEESGIKSIVEEKKSEILKLVKEKDLGNAYDAEQAILDIMENLPNHCPDVVDRLKKGAYETGSSVDTVLLVGSIYFRDLVFPELGFSVEQIDGHKK